MHPGVKPKDNSMTANEATAPKASATEQMFPVVLNKHYAPSGKFEIVGHIRSKVERKDAAGKMITIEPEQFIKGEMNPAPYPGTGFANKVWAGTHIRLPLDEAKAIITKKIAERADDIAA